MLKTKGRAVVDDNGSPVLLRGYNLSTWLMMENFMLGTPGVEQHFRQHLTRFAGKERADWFFETFLSTFVQVKDIVFLKELGCDHVRIPFNYRHFEDDGNPMVYKPDGFRHLDRVVSFCEKHGLYVVLDLHGAQGYQNPDWHSDNPTNRTGLYDNPFNQRRIASLWRHIAEHYQANETIAGYEIMNEPVCVGQEEIEALNRCHKLVSSAIREVDHRHILFVDGNLRGRSFEGFSEPWDDNLVCSVHYYTYPGLFTNAYPGWAATEVYYDKAYHAQQMDIRDSYSRNHNLPVWISEFGIIFNEFFNEDKKRVLADQLDIFVEKGYGWAQWGFKDIGNMGLVRLDPDGPWMRLIADVMKLKSRFHSDFDPIDNGPWDMIDVLRPNIRSGFYDRREEVEARVKENLSSVLAEELCKDLCRRLAGMETKELALVLSSFDLDNCLVREDWKALISKRLKNR